MFLDEVDIHETFLKDSRISQNLNFDCFDLHVSFDYEVQLSFVDELSQINVIESQLDFRERNVFFNVENVKLFVLKIYYSFAYQDLLMSLIKSLLKD